MSGSKKLIQKIKYTANNHPRIKAVARQPVVLYRKFKNYPETKKKMEMVMKGLPSEPEKGPVIWYFCEAEHRNLGDLAQRFCIEDWLSENFPGYSVYEIPAKVVLSFKKKMLITLKALIKKEDIIVFQSGYTMTGIHPDDRVRKIILPAFRRNRILIFPQTLLYDNDKKREQVYRALKCCKRILLLTRDQKSYEMAQKIFPGIPTELYPDIVTTQIGKRDYSGFIRKGIGLCVRDDGEKYYSFSEIDELRQKLSAIDQVDVTDTDCKDLKTIDSASIRDAVLKKITNFAEKRVIVTDRYHGTIFSLAAGTPVIVIKTRDHKVSTGVQWFKGIYDSNVFYCDNLEEVPGLVEEILCKADYAPLKPYFKQEYYDRLKELFLGGKSRASLNSRSK